jgi:putative flippase GtrA
MRTFRAFRAFVFSRYLIVSVIALLVDMALFVQLIELELTPASASALAYSAGIIAHWALSSRVVFTGRVARGRGRRAAQQAQFGVSALVGLGITTGIVTLGTYLGFDPALAKLAAIGVSFIIVWHIRNRYIFNVQSHDASQR